ncbi:hypothetical protein Nepgr_030815 [Nepenthes gracilis]|uniref:Uncharacterized protein n=1 Tax=Nepenthes gracilis TaxID=150966 RepID=A0AAD3TGG4_NEPGR|nr:hypothetical protein Nepgr_030815 [Nepenthes gracilis]
MSILQANLRFPAQPQSLSSSNAISSTHRLPISLLSKVSHLSLHTHKTTTIQMGGGPRTYPGGVSKWQWKRMQAKKAKQLLKARLSRERQIYEMRKRAELKAAVSELERPWEVVERAPALFSVGADEQVKVLADRFQKPGGFDLWTENDGPQLFETPDGIPTARFFPKGVVHSIKPYQRVLEVESDGNLEGEKIGGGNFSRNSMGRPESSSYSDGEDDGQCSNWRNFLDVDGGDDNNNLESTSGIMLRNSAKMANSIRNFGGKRGGKRLRHDSVTDNETHYGESFDYSNGSASVGANHASAGSDSYHRGTRNGIRGNFRRSGNRGRFGLRDANRTIAMDGSSDWSNGSASFGTKHVSDGSDSYQRGTRNETRGNFRRSGSRRFDSGDANGTISIDESSDSSNGSASFGTKHASDGSNSYQRGTRNGVRGGNGRRFGLGDANGTMSTDSGQSRRKIIDVIRFHRGGELERPRNSNMEDIHNLSLQQDGSYSFEAS